MGFIRLGCPTPWWNEAGMSGMEATSLYPQLRRQALCFQLENPVLDS